MPDAPRQRRFISPALLLVVLLCFFMPFFSVSCSSGVAQMNATVTGADQVFGGEPDYTGFRPPPGAQGATGMIQESSQVSPPAVVGYVAILVGIAVGLGLPRPRLRWLSGAAASGAALAAVVVNQVMVHDRAQQALEQVESSFRTELGNNSIFGQSIPIPVFDVEDEPGFWVVTVLLGLALVYNMYEVFVLQRGPGRQGSVAYSVGGPQPPPAPGADSGADGWTQSRPPRMTDPRSTEERPPRHGPPTFPQAPPPDDSADN